MKTIIDGVGQEIDFSDLKFVGKLYGKNYQRLQATEFLKRIRVLLFIVPIYLFYPLVTNFLFYDVFGVNLFVEKLVFAFMLIGCGFLFNKNPLIAMIISIIPPVGMLRLLVLIEMYEIKTIALYIAIIILLSLGIYNYYKEKRLKKVLIKEFMNGNKDAILEEKIKNQKELY